MRNFIKNFFYQAIFQIVKLLMPILTVPIVSHALGPTNLGVYSFTTSVVQYFILFASLGMGFYGQRLIATVRDDKAKLSKTFWELELLSAVTTVITLVVYFVFIINSEYRFIFLIQSLTIFSVALDISWLFKGLEDFKKTSLRSVGMSFFTFICIFLFVKDSGDLYKYVIIQTFGLLGSQIVMWPFLINRISFVSVSIRNIYSHFTRVIQYFIPQISITLYSNIGKTLLGVMATKSNVAFFSNSLMIISVIVTFISTADSVLLPKLSYFNAKKEHKKILSVLSISFDIQLYFTIPIFFGLIAVANNLVPWFFGSSFNEISSILPVMAILCIIKPLGSAVTNQWLLPLGQLKVYNISIIIGGMLSIVLNALLIPQVGVWGAVLAVILCEMFVTVTRVIEFIKTTKFKFNYLLYIKLILVAAFMGIIIIFTSKGMPATLSTTVIQCLLGSTIYIGITTATHSNPIIEYRKVR